MVFEEYWLDCIFLVVLFLILEWLVVIVEVLCGFVYVVLMMGVIGVWDVVL